MYDVVIAGGGPAGLSAAYAAARGGARAVVLERESAFGIPTRTSGGSFIRQLRDLGIPDRLWVPIHEVRFLGPDTEAVLRYPEPVVCVLDVRALYQWLAERAAGAGAELRLRSTVLGAQLDGSGVEVRVRAGGQGATEALRARYAVDATGTAAVLTGALGLHPPFERRGVGAELDLAAPAFPPDTCVLAMGNRIAPSGYAWAFPYRQDRVRLGVGVMRPDSTVDPRSLLDRARALPPLDGWLAGAQPIEVHAGIIPAEPLRTRLVSGTVVCAGDSGSHASTLVGEGIRYAIGAGAAAGTAIAEGARAGGSTAPLLGFERDWLRRHRRDFRIAYRINRLLADFDDDHWNRAVELLGRTPPWFVATALSSEFRPSAVLRLAARHPGLAARFLRAA